MTQNSFIIGRLYRKRSANAKWLNYYLEVVSKTADSWQRRTEEEEQTITQWTDDPLLLIDIQKSDVPKNCFAVALMGDQYVIIYQAEVEIYNSP